MQISFQGLAALLQEEWSADSLQLSALARTSLAVESPLSQGHTPPGFGMQVSYYDKVGIANIEQFVS